MDAKVRVLIAEDDSALAHLPASTLSHGADFEVGEASTWQATIDRFRVEEWDHLPLDLNFPDSHALDESRHTLVEVLGYRVPFDPSRTTGRTAAPRHESTRGRGS